MQLLLHQSKDGQKKYQKEEGENEGFRQTEIKSRSKIATTECNSNKFQDINHCFAKSTAIEHGRAIKPKEAIIASKYHYAYATFAEKRNCVCLIAQPSGYC